MGLINRISGGLKTAEVPLHVTGRRSWKTRFNYNKSFMEIPWNKLKNGNENELNVFNIVYRFILSRASYSTKGYKFYVMIQYCSTLVSSWLINNPIRPVFVYLYVSFFSFFFVGFFWAQTADCDVSCLRHKRMSNDHQRPVLFVVSCTFMTIFLFNNMYRHRFRQLRFDLFTPTTYWPRLSTSGACGSAKLGPYIPIHIVYLFKSLVRKFTQQLATSGKRWLRWETCWWILIIC
jgi:hypothetical protein